jgi:SAM-dependent methyltransferase
MRSGKVVPFNYRFLVERSLSMGGCVLDYGCGDGSAVAYGLSRGLDIWGADTFTGYYAEWANLVLPQAKERIVGIESGRASFPDHHFNVVFSNQVLEHVTDPEAVLADMHRLLKPGGMFIAAFPVREAWYEGHIGLYFAHRFKVGSRWRHAYFDFCHRIGLGLYRGNLTRTQWLAYLERTLDEACFYYPKRRLRAAIKNIFGTSAEDIAAEYMRARLGRVIAHFPTAADPILRFVYHIRAGEILQVINPR